MKTENRIEQNKEFYAPVEMIKSQDVSPALQFLSYNSSQVIVDHPELGKVVVNNCSDGYGLIPTYHIFPAIEEKLEEEYFINREYEVKNVAKFYTNYTIKDNAISVKNEQLEPFIRIQHSYNSKIQFSALFGFYIERLDTYLYGGGFKPVMLSHTEGNIERIIEDTLEGVQLLVEEMHDLPHFELLSSHNIKKANIESTLESIIKDTKFHQIPNEILETIQSEMKHSEVKQCNLWIIYTSMMWHLNNNANITMQPENKTHLDIKVFIYLIDNFCK